MIFGWVFILVWMEWINFPNFFNFEWWVPIFGYWNKGSDSKTSINLFNLYRIIHLIIRNMNQYRKISFGFMNRHIVNGRRIIEKRLFPIRFKWEFLTIESREIESSFQFRTEDDNRVFLIQSWNSVIPRQLFQALPFKILFWIRANVLRKSWETNPWDENEANGYWFFHDSINLKREKFNGLQVYLRNNNEIVDCFKWYMLCHSRQVRDIKLKSATADRYAFGDMKLIYTSRYKVEICLRRYNSLHQPWFHKTKRLMRKLFLLYIDFISILYLFNP